MPEIFVSPEKKDHDRPIKKYPHHGRIGGRRKFFSAYNPYPEYINFETKDKNEEIVLMLRQHPIVNVKWVVISIFLFLCPALIEKTGLLSLLPDGYRLIIHLTWYLVSFAYAIEGFFGWYFNVYFITTRRVIDVDFFNLIDKRVSDAEIEKIQDVSYTTSGAIGTTFNYADLIIQTASEFANLNFEKIPNPEKAAEILDDLRAAVH